VTPHANPERASRTIAEKSLLACAIGAAHARGVTPRRRSVAAARTATAISPSAGHDAREEQPRAQAKGKQVKLAIHRAPTTSNCSRRRRGRYGPRDEDEVAEGRQVPRESGARAVVARELIPRGQARQPDGDQTRGPRSSRVRRRAARSIQLWGFGELEVLGRARASRAPQHPNLLTSSSGAQRRRHGGQGTIVHGRVPPYDTAAMTRPSTQGRIRIRPRRDPARQTARFYVCALFFLHWRFFREGGSARRRAVET